MTTNDYTTLQRKYGGIDIATTDEIVDEACDADLADWQANCRHYPGLLAQIVWECSPELMPDEWLAADIPADEIPF